MADQIQLEVATPERLVVREPVTEIQLPGKDGYMGILPGHAALLGMLGTGVLTYRAGSVKHALAVQGGFIEVLPEHVSVLANSADPAEEIDLERARQELKSAQEQLASAADPEAALAAVARAQARVDAAEAK
jgi:F-type H+-transporting ATPase subunit epsilon